MLKLMQNYFRKGGHGSFSGTNFHSGGIFLLTNPQTWYSMVDAILSNLEI